MLDSAWIPLKMQASAGQATRLLTNQFTGELRFAELADHVGCAPRGERHESLNALCQNDLVA
jgi:hypothetical protein